MPDLVTLMKSIVECYNYYAGKDGDTSSLTMKEMSELFMKELFPWMESLDGQRDVITILESYGEDIEAGMDFIKFGKLLIDFASVLQNTSSTDK